MSRSLWFEDKGGEGYNCYYCVCVYSILEPCFLLHSSKALNNKRDGRSELRKNTAKIGTNDE